MATDPVRAETLPDAIRRVRQAKYGTLDNIAAALGTSRQRVIDWEAGAVPSKKFRGRLIELGVPERLFTREEQRAEALKRLRAVEAETVRIRRLLEG